MLAYGECHGLLLGEYVGVSCAMHFGFLNFIIIFKFSVLVEVVRDFWVVFVWSDNKDCFVAVCGFF